ncbi:hypothetical protein U3516DRAFT_772003 [Neocallimastix sp. 'constans']
MEENLIIDKKILKYDNSPEKEYDVSLSIMNNKIKDGIEKSSIPFDLYVQNIIQLISQISRNLNKNLPSNFSTFTEIPNESKYCKTKRVKLFREYNDDIFVDGTFFIAPKFSYQIFIKRTYAKELDKSLNSYLNNLFPTIPSYYELIDKLNELEHLPYYDYQRKIRGIWKIKKRAINKANEISVLIECYKNIETKLIDANVIEIILLICGLIV